MRTIGILTMLICTIAAIVIIDEGENTLSEGRYCKLTEGGMGTCEMKQNCDRADSANQEKCSSPFVCCPLPGTKSRNKCEEYSRIDTTSTCQMGDGFKAQRKEFPHMVSLGFNSVIKNEWICGGVLISERYILTAAHCVTNMGVGKPRRVRLGDLQQADKEVIHVQQLTVEEVIPHPNFTQSTYQYNIALLKLARDVQFTPYVRPVCLHTAMELPVDTGVTLGWGLTADGNISSELLKIDIPFVSLKACKEMYKNISTSSKIILDTSVVCAGDKGKIACNGDSGGPLQIPRGGHGCMADLVGLTALGAAECDGIIPNIFSRISYFVPWIESVVWP